MRHFARRLAAVAILIILAACTDDAISPEQAIRQFVAQGVEAGEARSVDAIDALLHPDYRDQQGYDRDRLGKLLQLYFLRHQNVHLFTRIDEIGLLADDEAEVNLFVAMAGSAITDAGAIPSLRARIYRFELRLLRTDRWRLQYARWQPATFADLQ